MRYDVRKFLFMGAVKDKLSFFQAAQNVGIIEFIQPKGQKKLELPQDIDNMLHAIKILRNYTHQPNVHVDDFQKAEGVTNRILALKEELDTSEQKQHDVGQEIERILPFGEFSLDSLGSLEDQIKRKVRFFAAKTNKHLDTLEPALIKVNEKDEVDYFVAIQNEPIVFADLVEFYFTTPLSELKKQQKELGNSIAKIHEELRSLTRYDALLHHALIKRLNEAHLAFAEEASALELENQLFIVEGWVPSTKMTELKKLTDAYHVYIEEVAFDKHDVPPTYLQNAGTAKVGEDLIRIFDTPSTKDRDPSLWVLFAFALFFSMIVYDAGYGLIFLATALILRFRLKKITPPTKRFIGLIGILATACILWGGLSHSIFGIEMSPDSFIRKHSLMTYLIKKKAAYVLEHKEDYDYYVNKYPQIKGAKTPDEVIYAHGNEDSSHHVIASKFTDNVLLELSLLLGAIHICIGLIRYLGKNPVGFGWVAFIIGAYLYVPYYLNATSIIHYVFGLDKEIAAQFGLHLLLFGLVFASIAGVILHGIAGLFEWTHAIQLFADVLSYLRIYALGYAGFIVSETVNMLAGRMPLIFAIFVVCFGHILNMVIAILGGTIHGLRLNFLEWYRYSFYGGGKDFRPLHLMTLE